MELYISNRNYSSWSLRAWILMRVLGIPFTERQVHYSADNPREFGKFSPTSLVPCLIDGEVTVWESLAIAEYLYESNPAVWPEDRIARAFARSAASEMHAGFSGLRSVCGMNCGIRVSLPGTAPELQRDLDRLQSLFEEGLTRFGGPFLAGSAFTAVDAFFAPVAFRAQTYGLHLGAAADGYLKHLRTLPEMQEWYAAAIRETQRSAPHEASIAGTIIEDLRSV